MNQSIIATIQLDDQLAKDIWAMLVAPPQPESVYDATVCAQGDQINPPTQNETSNLPDLATEILSSLEQKKETATAALGISQAQVETMPFDLTALGQSGIFLNMDATGFSVPSRQLD